MNINMPRSLYIIPSFNRDYVLSELKVQRRKVVGFLAEHKRFGSDITAPYFHKYFEQAFALTRLIAYITDMRFNEFCILMSNLYAQRIEAKYRDLPGTRQLMQDNLRYAFWDAIKRGEEWAKTQLF